MKIKETIERNCCNASCDMVQMHGSPPGRRYFFCKYCGRWWEEQGGSEPGDGGLQALPWPWETKAWNVGTTRG